MATEEGTTIVRVDTALAVFGQKNVFGQLLLERK